MEELGFNWDDNKAARNIKKHNISFEEAISVFYDENAIEFYDPEHSDKEDRFLMIGLSWRLRVIVVSYCLRNKGLEIRIISARKASKKEHQFYVGRIL